VQQLSSALHRAAHERRRRVAPRADATGFRRRPVQIGAWGGKDPKGEYEFDEDHVEK
jgi:hypothetical protein